MVNIIYTHTLEKKELLVTITCYSTIPKKCACTHPFTAARRLSVKTRERKLRKRKVMRDWEKGFYITKKL